MNRDDTADRKKKMFFSKINLRGIAVRGRKYFRDLLRDSLYLPAQSRASALCLQDGVKRLKMVGKEKKKKRKAEVLRLHLWLNASSHKGVGYIARNSA